MRVKHETILLTLFAAWHRRDAHEIRHAMETTSLRMKRDVSEELFQGTGTKQEARRGMCLLELINTCEDKLLADFGAQPLISLDWPLTNWEIDS
jgi:hypothetical protein